MLGLHPEPHIAAVSEAVTLSGRGEQGGFGEPPLRPFCCRGVTPALLRYFCICPAPFPFKI